MELTDEQIAQLTPEQITEIENNPDAIEQILANQEKSSEEPNDEPEPEEEAERANDAGEDHEEPKDDEEEKPVVLTKSGKGTIPYEKYKQLRVENATLRERVDALQKTQTELETLRTQKAEARTPERRAEIQKKLAERIATMKEDFPEIGNSLDSVNEILTDLTKEIEEDRAAAKAKAEEEKAERERIIAEQVQEAKENNPDLMHWEANDEDAWNEALMQDEILRNTTKWAKKSYDERFVEVVKRVRAIMPEASAPPNTEPPAEKPKETKEKAKAKLEKAVERKPTTLSDIQGGANPASESEQLENLNPFELARKLLKMPAQQAAAMRADIPD